MAKVKVTKSLDENKIEIHDIQKNIKKMQETVKIMFNFITKSL